MIRLFRSAGGGGMPNGFLCFTLLAVIFLSSAFFVSAQSITGTSGNEKQGTLILSPEAAVDMAIKNNLMLESARIGTDMKKRKSDLVWNEFLPTLGINGTLSRDNWATTQQGLALPADSFGPGLPPSTVVLSPSMTLPQWHVLGSFSAELVFSFALIEGIKSIKLDYQASQVSYDKAKLQMEQGVRKMYNQILLLEANAGLLADSYSNAQHQADIAEANYRAGLAPRLTWLQAQVAVENMKPSVDELENGLKTLKGNFALILGLSFDTPFELETVSTGAFFIPSDVGEFISRSASGKPDIQELQANIVALNSQRKALALQQYTPYLRFGWTLSSMFDPRLDPFKETWFSRDNWNKGGNFSITLGMSFNSLFSFTKEGQMRKDMEAGLQIQNIMLSQMIRETELEIFTKINSLEKTRTTTEAQQGAVNLAEESYRLTEEAFRAGLQDLQAVRNASLAYDQAKLQLLTQQFNYLNDLIDLEYSIGVPFGTLSSNGTFNNGSAK